MPYIKKFNLIGPGRVGLALTYALANTPEYSLSGIYHPNHARAKKATQQLGFGMAFNQLDALPPADITFIATQDQYIKPITAQLAAHTDLKPGSFVIHLSGILSSDILKPLKSQAVYIGSLHPLKAFCEFETPDKNIFKHIDCAIEGEKRAVTQLKALGLALGASVFKIQPEKKASYHAAACIASNYLVTLAAEAVQLFENAGIGHSPARKLCSHLMQTSLNNLNQQQTIKDALTGPLMRGEIETIKEHLGVIDAQRTKTLYEAAGLATLPLTKLPPETRHILKALFSS